MSDELALTTRQELFIDAYLGGNLGNATQSAIAAGYAADSAHVEGYRLLRNAKVRAAIDEHLETLSMTRAEVVSNLSAMGRDTHMLPLARVKALETLARVHGLIIERQRQEQVGDITVRIVREAKVR